MSFFSKFFACVFITLFSLNFVSAQTNKHQSSNWTDCDQYLEGTLGVLFPMGDLSDEANTGFGLFGAYNHKVANNLFLSGSIGYGSFGEKSASSYDYYNNILYLIEAKANYSVVPILIGVKYHFAPINNKIIPYIGGELGLYNFSASGDGYINGVKVTSISNSETDFGIALKGGIIYPINDKIAFDAQLQFNKIFVSGSNISYLKLGVGLDFCLSSHSNAGWTRSDDVEPPSSKIRIGQIPAKNPEDNYTLTYDDIEFKTGKSDLNVKSENKLRNILVVLQAHKTYKLDIVGYTDDVGSNESNLQLSYNRAKAVKNWFETHGIESDRMTIDGKGEADPIANNDSDENRQKNRRVEIQIIK